MISILFVCHGNICRSPMAEFVMRDKLVRAGLQDIVKVQSAATSTEEIGEDTHHGTRRILDKYNIPYTKRAARQITSRDIEDFDYIIGMDSRNMSNMRRFWGNKHQEKLSMLMEWTGISRDVADPWYTGDFQTTFEDIDAGCEALLTHLRATCR